MLGKSFLVSKTWDPDKPNKLLIEQTYPGVEDYEAHFNALLPAFKDPRYMKVNGKLIFGLFAPLDIPDAKFFKETWNKLAIKNGLNGFVFFGYLPQSIKSDKINKVLSIFDYVVLDQYATAITSKITFSCEYKNGFATIYCINHTLACIRIM